MVASLDAETGGAARRGKGVQATIVHSNAKNSAHLAAVVFKTRGMSFIICLISECLVVLSNF